MADGSEQLNGQVRALLAITEAMNATLARRAVLDQTLAAIVRELEYRAALIRLYDPEAGALKLAASSGLSDEYLNKGEVKIAQGGVDQRVFEGEIVAIAEITAESGLQYPAAAQREGLRGVLAVPLRLGNKVVGVLRVFTGEPHEFSAVERAFMAGVANLAARAIANAGLYESFRAIAKQVNSSLEVREVLRKLLRSLIDEINVHAAAVRLVGPNRRRLHLAAAEGLSEAYLAKGEIRIADSPMDTQVLTTGKPVLVYDVETEPAFQYPKEAAQEGIRSVLAVPLTVRDQLVGVLRVYSGQPHRFTAEEIALVEAVADLGGLALDNARLHEALNEKYQAAREDWSGWYRYLTMS